MHITHLSDPELLHATQSAAQREKHATLELLEHLLEVDRRGLALSEGHPSLWAYVHHGLGYSEGAASERVAAMRLLKRAPVARDALRENKLTLTVAAQIQHFVRAVEKAECRSLSPEETARLISEVEGKSKRDVERLLMAKSPAATTVRESVRHVGAEVAELRIGMDAELCQLLAEAKALAGAANHAETIKRALKKFVAARRKELEPKSVQKDPQTRPAASSHSRYIPREALRALFQRSEYRCEFVAETGRRCPSQHKLQVDHIRPLSLGGTSDPSNLRILCQSHNLAAAREWGLVPEWATANFGGRR